MIDNTKGANNMGLFRKLRALAEALPPGASVNIPAEWLLEELENEVIEDAPQDDSPIADITVEQLAGELNRSPSTVRGWLSSGAFPGAYRLQGREWRIPRTEVEAFLNRQRPQKPVAVRQAPRRQRTPADLGAWRKTRRETAK